MLLSSPPGLIKGNRNHYRLARGRPKIHFQCTARNLPWNTIACFQRIGKEEAIRLHEVDVVCSSDASHFICWKRDGLLAPYVPEDVARHFPPEQIDPDGMYASTFALLSPVGYNTNLVKREDAPDSFAALLDPK